MRRFGMVKVRCDKRDRSKYFETVKQFYLVYQSIREREEEGFYLF